MRRFDNLHETLLDWHRQGRRGALATVIETWGSAPRPAGSQLAISGEGEIEGSVSGGCVEGAVIVEAMDAMEDGAPRMLEFGVSDDEAFAVGLACGGRIRVLVEPLGIALRPALLEEMIARRQAAEAFAYLVNTATWERRLAGPEDRELGAEVAARLLSDRSGPEGDWFIAVQNPPLRLLVVGAVHIAQPLVSMARIAGYDPLVIDPRDSFASAERFPGETLCRDWPDEALEAANIDARTAVVALTHDPKLDDPALSVALRSRAFYVGALGSSRTHAKRLTRLETAGFTGAECARLHAPVGLDIGAATPAEIALAIMAEITLRLRRGGEPAEQRSAGVER